MHCPIQFPLHVLVHDTEHDKEQPVMHWEEQDPPQAEVHDPLHPFTQLP